MYNKKNFANNLNYFLSDKRITKVELAKICGVGKSTVTAWCKGEKLPRMDKIQILCDLFHCHYSDLIDESKENTAPPTGSAASSELVNLLLSLPEEAYSEVMRYARYLQSQYPRETD